MRLMPSQVVGVGRLSGLIITRVWSMSSKWTFRIPVVREFIDRHLTEDGRGWADPFSGTNTVAEYRNDLRERDENGNRPPVDSHLPAIDWIPTLPDGLNGALYDPPYSPTQLRRIYTEMGRKVGRDDTNAHFGSAVVARAGFVMDRAPAVNPLTVQKIADAHSQTGADVTLGRFEEWALDRANQVATGNLDALGRAWLQAYAESLCQKRRDIVPIDEPSKPWVDGLRALLP
jgi:hypothetical protein